MAGEKRPTLTVEERAERGSREARRLRRAGLVPGVLYGGSDGDSVSFKVDGGKARPVIVKEQQFHPVREELLHIDLLEVRLDEKIQSPVSVELTGVEESPGVKEGGVLEHVTRELNIEALPTDIPDNIAVDVSSMEVAATMHLSEIVAPAGVTFLDDLEETIIATVVVPTEIEEPEIEEETELVGEEGELPEGEEAPGEGEEAEAAGEAEPQAEGEGRGEES